MVEGGRVRRSEGRLTDAADSVTNALSRLADSVTDAAQCV